MRRGCTGIHGGFQEGSTTTGDGQVTKDIAGKKDDKRYA